MYVSFFSWLSKPFAGQKTGDPYAPSNQAGWREGFLVKGTGELSGLLRYLSGYFEKVAKIKTAISGGF
jgi:hypothetical protein